MPQISRRRFLMGCSAAIAAMAGSRLTQLAFAQSPEAAAAAGNDVLVVVFLRGAWDAFNILPVLDGQDRSYYEAARPDLQVKLSGENSALRFPNNAQFGLHSAMAPLMQLYQDGRLAIVNACGLKHNTRSHFDAMQFIETGTGGQVGVTTGWLTRHLQTFMNLNVAIPALSAGNSPAASLLGYTKTVTMSEPSGLDFSGHWKFEERQQTVLRQLYDGETWAFTAGTRSLNTLDVIPTGDYTPANGAQYPDNSFGESLKAIAQIIKANLGLQTATVDFGGWDTHEGQGVGSRTGTNWNYFHNQVDALARGLLAFYTDLNGAGASNYTSRLTVAVMSEFGRRLRQNDSGGTDHGHGSAMFVMGGGVNGRQIYGTWPGLSPNQLFDGADLEITSDYRNVLTEILLKRANQQACNLGVIFPGFTGYTPLGIVQQATLTAAAEAPANEVPAAGPFAVYLPLVGKNIGQPTPGCPIP